MQQVILAPVPSVHLEFLAASERSRTRVAFGTSSSSLNTVPEGQPLDIYASNPPSPLYRGFFASWQGTFDRLVPAVVGGMRDGQCPDESIRHPTAECSDTAFKLLFEVSNLSPLKPPISLRNFQISGKPLKAIPWWPMLVLA